MLLLGQLAVSSASGQQEEGKTCPVSVNFGAALRSRHVWNGGLSCDSWNLQPDFTVSAYGFSFNAWGYFPITSTWAGEIDFTLAYQYGPFRVSYSDFFYPQELEKFNHYMRWRKEDGGNLHQQWVQLSFAGVEKFPISLEWGMFTFGDYSKKGVTDGAGNPILGPDGAQLMEVDKARYSMYFGLGYSHTLSTGQTLSYAVGGTPYKGFFADGPNVVNLKVGIDQPVKITDSYTLNLGGTLVYNPYRENLYFVLTIGIF